MLSHGKSSVVSDHSNNDHYTLRSSPSLQLELHLRYRSQGKGVSVVNKASFSTAITIREVAKEFLKLVRSDIDTPKDIILVLFGTSDKTYPVPPHNADMTLGALTIMDGYKLFFEASSSQSRSRLLQLTIYGPDGLKQVRYEYDKSSTTLNILLNHVVQTFSLGTIERERIHLFTSTDEELNLIADSEKLLSRLDIGETSWIDVKIIPSYSASIGETNLKVHVQCTHTDGIIYSDVSITDTIRELQNKIKNKFQGRILIDFILYDKSKKKIDLSDPGRMLLELGIKSGETIYVTTRTGFSKVSLPLIRSRVNQPLSSSLPVTQKDDEITIICKFSNFDSETICVSVKDTVATLKAKISALRKEVSLTRIFLYSTIVDIDDKQLNRCMADFGVKPGSRIHATILDDTRTYSSVVSRGITASNTRTRQHQGDPKPIGLDNLGNTCFMNSALQCLFHVKPLTEFFLNAFTQAHLDDGEHKNDDWNPFDACGNVTGAYAELIWNVSRRDETDHYDSSFKPDRIKDTIGCLAPQFATWDQQDAQEFLSFLLDALHDEFKEHNKPNPNNLIKELFFGQMQSTITCLKCKNVEKTINPFCILSLPLHRQQRLFSINFISSDGHQDSAVLDVPTCARAEHLVLAFTETRKNYILFYRIYAMTTNTNEHLPFETPLSELPDQFVTLIEQEEDVDSKRRRPERYETQPHKLTLEECLREFVSLELLEDLWFCPRDECKQRTEASKQLQLSTLPPILAIQLKRFSHDGSLRQKIDTLVEYPINGLDLSHLLPLSEKAVYDLIAVSNHIGSIYGGHYTAYGRQDVSTDKWYKFDDDFVSTVYYTSDVVSRDAYLLFYIKRNDQKQSSKTKPTTS